MEERRDAEKTPRRFSLWGEGEGFREKRKALRPFQKKLAQSCAL